MDERYDETGSATRRAMRAMSGAGSVAYPPTGVRRAARLALTALLAAATGLSACAPKAPVHGGGIGPSLEPTVHLSVGSVRVDFSVVGDAVAILREAAGDALTAADLDCHGQQAVCATLDLAATLRAPSPAFASASPPIRILELAATFHGAGAKGGNAVVRYERSISAAGNLSTATWMRLADALATDLVTDFRFRASRGGLVVRLRAWAGGEATLSRASAPGAFHVAITGDDRADRETIGSVGGRQVRAARTATDYLTEAITDELRATGHAIVPALDGRLVGSQLHKFWLATNPAASGYETTAEIELSLEVAPPPGVKRKKASRLSCRSALPSRDLPSEADLAVLLERCVADLLASLRSDPLWARE